MPERELYFHRRQSLTWKHSYEDETKMGDGDSGGADMAVELEAGLNPTSDPTSEGNRRPSCGMRVSLLLSQMNEFPKLRI